MMSDGENIGASIAFHEDRLQEMIDDAQSSIMKELADDIEFVRSEHANNKCTIEGCSKLAEICDLALTLTRKTLS